MRHVIKQHSMHIFIMRMWHVITQHNMHARPRSVYLGAKIDLRGLEGVFRRKLDVELKLATLIRRALGPYQRRKTNTHTHTHTHTRSMRTRQATRIARLHAREHRWTQGCCVRRRACVPLMKPSQEYMSSPFGAASPCRQGVVHARRHGAPAACNQ